MAQYFGSKIKTLVKGIPCSKYIPVLGLVFMVRLYICVKYINTIKIHCLEFIYFSETIKYFCNDLKLRFNNSKFFFRVIFPGAAC